MPLLGFLVVQAGLIGLAAQLVGFGEGTFKVVHQAIEVPFSLWLPPAP